MLRSFSFKNRIYSDISFAPIWKLYSSVYSNDHSFDFIFLLSEEKVSLRNDKIIQWCVDNISGRWCFNLHVYGFEYCYYYFKDDNDAMAFKLFTGLDLE